MPQKILTSPEYNSFLSDSTIDTFVVNFTKEHVSNEIEIGFRASNIPNDPISDKQWTIYAPIYDSNTTISYRDLGITKIRGRYKQIRFRFTY